MSCGFAAVAEFYGWPLPFEPLNPRNRKPGQKYLSRFIVWPVDDDIEPPAPVMTFEEQQEEFMALMLHVLS